MKIQFNALRAFRCHGMEIEQHAEVTLDGPDDYVMELYYSILEHAQGLEKKREPSVSPLDHALHADNEPKEKPDASGFDPRAADPYCVHGVRFDIPCQACDMTELRNANEAGARIRETWAFDEYGRRIDLSVNADSQIVPQQNGAPESD